MAFQQYDLPEVELDLGAMVLLEELQYSWFKSFIDLSELQGVVVKESEL
jgi:hypothetical protein